MAVSICEGRWIVRGGRGSHSESEAKEDKEKPKLSAQLALEKDPNEAQLLHYIKQSRGRVGEKWSTAIRNHRAEKVAILRKLLQMQPGGGKLMLNWQRSSSPRSSSTRPWVMPEQSRANNPPRHHWAASVEASHVACMEEGIWSIYHPPHPPLTQPSLTSSSSTLLSSRLTAHPGRPERPQSPPPTMLSHPQGLPPHSELGPDVWRGLQPRRRQRGQRERRGQ